MKSMDFRGLPNIQQVECSGQGLSPDSDVFSLTLFSLPRKLTSSFAATTSASASLANQKNGSILAFVNLKNNECSTTSSYSACVVDHKESQRSRVVSLVMDVEEGDTVWLGCNVSWFRSGVFDSVTWRLADQ
ncbi:hypothetical protein ACOMHN_036792 [Nucella lapillus]